MTEISVGIVTHHHFPRLGGMEIYNHMLAAALSSQAGVGVAVACGTMPEIPRTFGYRYPVYRARSLSYLTPYLARRNVDEMIRRERVDILHGATLHGAGVNAVRSGERHRLPTVVQSHGSDVQVVDEIGYGAGRNAEDRSRIRFVLENANAVLAVSTLNRDMILEAGGPPERTHVAPPACAFEAIGAVPFKDLRTALGIDAEDFVIVTVGRNRPIKRLGLLFESLSILKRNGRRIRCLCVGPEEDLSRAAAEHDVGDRIHLVGRVPAPATLHQGISPPFPLLINLYRAADLYVSVSYFESFGLAAMDAIACGTPILVTPRHGVIDVVREGENGYVLQEETADALADRLEALAAMKETLNARRDAVRASVSSHTWTAAAASLASLYRTLV